MSRFGNRVRRSSRGPLSGRSGPLAWGVALLVVLVPTTSRAGDPVEFNRDIRPIFRETCFTCHGPDSASRKADLRLDKREAAVASGAITPGDPSASEIITRILSDDPEEMMPPPASHKALTAAQKDLLKRWVAAGAEYQPHWAFLPPKKVEPPAVKDAGWPRNPVDRFLLAKMEEKGFRPAPEADRRTLARRLSLDLTGLPPAPLDVEAFLADPAPDAYERYVDKLLAAPGWGEHRGRYWLDAARYADTHGIHFDNFREIWSYRDWVINAFNKNQPFDQFTVEQLAGDLIPNRTLDQQVASGFNRCNITTNEGGAINEEYLVLYTRDRTETVAQTWLGLTAGCAVCHDHKFDPISQKEFYSLAAFFNNSTQAAMDGNISNTPPTVIVPALSDRGRWETLSGELAGAKKDFDARKAATRPEFDRWLAAATPESLDALRPVAGQKLRARLDDRDSAAKSTGAALELADVGDFEKDQAFSYGLWVKPGRKGLGGAILARMDDAADYRGWDLWLENGKLAAHIISKWPEDAVKVTSDGELKPGVWNHVQMTHDGSGKAAGVKLYLDGKLRAVTPQADALKGSIKAAVPLKLAQRDKSSKVDDALFHDLRVHGRALSADEVEALVGLGQAGYLAAKVPDKRTGPEAEAAFAWYLATQDPATQGLGAALAKLEREQAALMIRGTVAHVMNERPEAPTAFVLFRGDYDKRRDQVKADTPAFLPPIPSDLPKNRLGFAQWLVRPEHPLTARVTVNRFWQELFGNGLVKTAGDFGLTGDLPTHPELLDWLAVDFRDNGWDVKRFFKLLVTSAAYRQSAAATPGAIEQDPQDRYLARGARYRMDAEMIRDYALAASGLLVEKLGGPSVRPYQPAGVWEAVAMPGSNTRNYKHDAGEGLYRRSMYTLWKRAAPPASMDIFNAPAREVCAVRRERTNTPLQALVTLNDEQFIEAARHLAQRALKEGGDAADARLDFVARRLLARPLRVGENRVIRDSLDGLLAYYQGHVEDAKKVIAVGDSKADASLDVATLAAWTMLANELLNLDEVLNK